MRELTEEELKLAPCWATHYINKCFIVVFLSNHLRQVFIKEGSYFNRLTLNDDGIDGALKIPSKLFNITNHEWSDDALCFGCVDCEGDIEISCTDTDGEFYIARHDAIAIAKHFCLTEEDLK